MRPLAAHELDLLDFLCSAAHRRMRVRRVKAGLLLPLMRLRRAGLIQPDSFLPTVWALADWLERQDADRILDQIYETLAEPSAAEPPPARAADQGGAASARGEHEHALAENDAAPPAFSSPLASPQLADARPREPFREARESAAAASCPVRARPARPRSKGPGTGRGPGAKASRAKALAARKAKAPMSGAELAAELDAFMAERRIPKRRLGLLLGSSNSGVERIRKRQFVGQDLVDKARAIMADPPADLYDHRAIRPRKNAKGASGKARKAPSAEGLPSAKRISDRAPAAEPRLSSPQPAGAHSSASAPPRRDWSKPPPGYQGRPGAIDLTEAVIKTAQAKATPRRKAIIEEARARNEAGLSSGDLGVSIHVRMTQRALAEQEERAAREQCPIEKAKLILARRFAPVCAAEVVGGKKGMFLVGRRFVSKGELLEMAEDLAA